jgi:peptide/nickel transport system substrate-binding protein
MAGSAAAIAGTGIATSMVGKAVAQQGGILRTGWGARGPRTIDPHKSIQGVDEWAINHIHDKLVRIPSGRFPDTLDEFEPGLATSWEGSEDSRTWTFELREGVQFQKGYGEFTSEDVKFSFDRVRDTDRIGLRHAMYENIAEVTTDGPYRVVFHLAQPDPLFLLSGQTHHTCNIMCKRAVEEIGEEEIGFSPIGTGPYMLETVHEDPSDGVTIVANPEHWGEQPATERIQFTYIADTTARTLAVLSGDVHMVEGVRAPGWVPSIQQRDPNLLYDVVSPGSFFAIHINMEQEPFNDVRVRQALMYAIDRQQITEAMSPFGQRTWGLIPPSYLGGFTDETIPDELRYDHNPDRARELLAEAGFPNGFSFSTYTSQREDYSSIMLIVQEQLRNVGINMDLDIRDHTAFHADQQGRTNTLSQTSSTFPPVPTQPFVNWLSAAHPDIVPMSRYGIVDEGIDDLLEQTFAEADLDRRLHLVRQMEEKMLTDVPLIHVVTNGFMVVRSPRVELGYEVISGYANWDLTKAVVS